MAHVQPNGQMWATQTTPSGRVVLIPAPSPVGATVVTSASGAPTVAFAPATGIIQQPFVQQHKPVGKYGASLSSANAVWLGAMLIFGGATSFAGAAFSFVYYATFFESGIGIWAGAMYISAGSVSIAAGKHKTDNLIKAATGTVAAALACSLSQLILCGIGLAEDLDCYYDYYCYYGERLAANSLMIAAASIATAFGIALLAICGKAMCSKPKLQYAVQTGMPVQYVTPNGIPVQFVNPVQNSTPLQVTTAQVHYTTSAPETVQINGHTSNQHTTTTHAVATHSQNHYEQLTHEGVRSGHEHATVTGVGGVGYVNAGVDEQLEKL